MLTQKLYYENSHTATFTATVLSCTQTQKGYAVTLDATAFYPEGGGQAGDTGRLGTAAVMDTQECGTEILHLCDSPLEVGARVEGVLDYEHRFLRMQQHSGEHIVSGIIHRRYGYHNTGFHMGSQIITIDFDGVIPPQDLPALEAEANRAVWQNLPVRCWYPSPEELPGVPYRTKRALPWPVRIVEVPGFDLCACCGTHVQATGEIGLVKLFSVIPFRGGSRMEMACGQAALDLLNGAWEQNKQVSQAFSAKLNETGAAARRMNQVLAEQKYRITGLERRIFAATAAQCAGKGDVLRFEEDFDNTAVRELADAIAGVCGGTAAVFSGSDAQGYAFCLANPAADLRQFCRQMVQALQGRGGGKPGFQQGRVTASREAIQTFFRNFPDTASP